MMDNWRKKILFSIIFLATIYNSNGCWMEGVDMWLVHVTTTILDTHSGIIFDNATRDIEGILSYSFIESLNGGPYLTVRHSDSRFIIETNDAFEDYEEYEIVEQFTVTVFFRCAGGLTNVLVFVINVEDTNNNPPQFPHSVTNEFVYTIHTPLAPGITITGCFGGITVRDIDLTTERIDFAIEENPYFEIAYDAAASTTDKEFIAILRSTTFIRTLPEPITFHITATDVDRTNDPRRTAVATVTIIGDAEFGFPDEPVFAQAFYEANYVDGDQIVLEEPISLRNGFHEEVRFTLDQESFNNFGLYVDGNQVLIRVVTPLAANVLRENQIILIVRADREYTSGDSATVIVHLPEEVPLAFERAHYEGTIENNILRVPQLNLIQGFEEETVVTNIFGEYASYFSTSISIQGNLLTLIMAPLTDAIINENNFISLEVVSTTGFSSATAVVSLEIVKDDNVTPVFNRPVYTGSYSLESGLILEEIVIVQGYDNTVRVSHEGDNADLFTISQDGSMIRLVTTGIPSAIFSQQRIELTLLATKPRTVGANAVIVITLPEARELDFEESTYRGTVQDNIIVLEPIVLGTGYDVNVVFELLGEHSRYFLTSIDENRVRIVVGTSIPANIIQENNVIILTVEASGLNAITTSTNVILDIIKQDITTPLFGRNIYHGTYEANTVLNIENIALTHGFADDVVFGLQGEHATYFQITQEGYNVVLTIRTAIPEEVIFSNKVLLFNVVALKPLTIGAHTTVTVTFPSELTESTVMRFTRNTYEATIENNNFRSDDIILGTGFQTGTEFYMTGAYSTYFRILDTGNVLSLTLERTLPVNEIESNFIVLDIEARRIRAVSTWTSVVIEIVREETQPLQFTSPYYRGVYNEERNTLSVEEISLALGYDETVVFRLEGALAPLFVVNETSNNRVTIELESLIPSAVLAENNQLLLPIAALRSDATTVRAAVSIDIERNIIQNTILRFDQVTYIGSIRDTTLNLGQITLNEGFTDDVTFDLLGDLSGLFTTTNLGGGVVGITLPQPIPEDSIPANRLVILEIRASAPQTVTAYATIVLEVAGEDDQPAAPQLVFSATYYTGTYTLAAGLTMNTPITLAEGYDQTVRFGLEGDYAQWFGVDSSGNLATLSVSSSIPAAVLANNQHLTFVVTAERAGSDTARSTIVLSLPDEHTSDSILGFDRVTYVGSIRDTTLNLGQITLNEGFTDDVTFDLLGDLSGLFTTTNLGGGVVGITLPQPIPEDSIPANRLVILEIRASAPQTVAAYATIVLEVAGEDDQPAAPQLVFSATYYTGTYTLAAGLTMNTPITLAEGYDQTVRFGLEGDHAQWFGVDSSGNLATLSVSSSIPAAVLANNQHLAFVVTAERAGSDTARSTIVLSLPDEHTSDSILGFDRVTYVGSIRDTTLNLGQITLNEGFTDDVTFDLLGDLSGLFTTTNLGGGVVGITLPQPIPEDSIPANRLVILEIRASAPQTVAAYATIVLEVAGEDDQPAAPQLVFSATYYTGTYTLAAGLTMNTPITLAEGYDQTVRFGLEGDHAQWFGVDSSGNLATLSVSSSIPAAVLANNQHLAFVVTAERAGSDTARSTIVLSLPDEHTSDSILGFDRVTYVGSIRDTTLNLGQITLNEGFTDDVTFDLLGDLSGLFTTTNLGGGVVGITLPQPIPEDSIPANRLVILEIRASAPQTVAAYATIVLEVAGEDDQPAAPQLVFSATYYTGTYTLAAGLTMNTPITLAEGYDQTVRFGLEGDHAQWFGVDSSGNLATLSVSSSIPAAVLANNQHLAFVVTAERAGSDTARSTIVLSLPDEHTSDSILGFDRVTYVGSIRDTTLNLGQITLNEGFTDDVTFDLLGDLSGLFTTTNLGGGVVGITLPQPIPEDSIPANRLVILEIRASAPQTVAAYATIVLEVAGEDDQPAAPQLVFSATYYTGTYTLAAGLTMNTPITLAEGYDQTVRFGLEGDHAQWFGVDSSGNLATLSVSSSIPAAVLANNQHLAFVVTAERAGSDTARSTIVLSLPDEHTSDSILGFDRVTYVGSIRDTTLNLGQITLNEGFTDDVTFDLLGDLSGLFTTTNLGGGVVGITLPQPIPEDSIPANRLVILEIRASAPQTVAAYATIVLEVAGEDDQPAAPQLVFSATYYTGTYTLAAGLTMNTPITLAEGYDQTVRFGLEGDHAQWFGVDSSGNLATLSVSSSIPAAVLANNQHLAFVVTAERAGSDTARSTIVLSLPDEHTSDSILGFDRVTYVGSIRDTTLNLGQITLNEGFTDDVTFDLLGDLSGLFTTTNLGGGVVGITLPQPIPEDSIPANRLVILEIRASAPQTVAAYATIVLEVAGEDDQPAAPQLVFSATYYTGTYTLAAGLTMNTPITLAEGYDQTVRFGLEGDHAQWFGVDSSGNLATLSVSSSIPAAVLANNQHLAFVVTAERAGSDTARSTIVLSLPDEHTSDSILGFDRVTYVGSIRDTTLNLGQITLNEGFTDDVTFDLLGDLSGLFTTTNLGGGVVGITLPQPIPEDSIPANRLVILEIRASAPQTVAAYATIVLEVAGEDDQPAAPQLVFSATYYTGTYTLAAGLTMNTPITLAEGYDQTVRFGLEGDHAQWFGVDSSGNLATLSVSSSIPAAVLANNQHLAFVVTAERAGSDTARSTIVLSLPDEHTSDSILGFDRVTYVGSIRDTTLNLGQITLNEGFTDDVTFDLLGDLSGLFTTTNLGGGVVGITLPQPIPEDSIPANRLVILEIRASAPQTVAAYATIVLEVAGEDDQPAAPQLVFSATYYTGTYTLAAGLTMNTPITLAEGYDQTVRFGLEGDHAQWFGVDSSGNLATLSISSSIPAAVLANNQHLAFVVTAERAGSDTARSTIVLSLPDEHSSDSILGFDRVTYLGSIRDTTLNLGQITLNEGFTDDVTFDLLGDLSGLFTTTNLGGGVVGITLPQPIPEDSIPANRLVILEIRASAPQTVAAYATIVLEVAGEDDQPAAPQLVFSATYYTGTYTLAVGLTMNTPITLAEGYDQTVRFGLEGDHAQWFGVDSSGNLATLSVSSSIPAAVLANNQHLAFVVTAERAGSDTARSTIVLSLPDEHTSDSILGFDQVTYVGSIRDTTLNLGQITLNEGFTDDVTFDLLGDLSGLFTTTNLGGGVIGITLPQPIPEDSIPANRLVILEIRASAPQTVAAFATIVLEVDGQDDQPAAPQLVFSATYYTGTYTLAAGLTMNTPIILAEGYDETVRFGLEGDNAQWFGVDSSGNLATLSVSSSIPAAVLANNQHLAFVVTAERAGSDTARSTIVLSLPDESQTGEDVSFDKLVYEGIIQLSTVQHELILISNHNGVNVQVYGEHATLFVASAADGIVTVRATGSVTLPDDVTHVVLELHAADATSVLLLIVIQTEEPTLPSVSFGSPSYIIDVDIVQTGLVGRVLATADNNEAVTYSLAIDNVHLQARVSVNSEGELHLSAPANSGVYSFQVIATTVITQAEGTATVHLTVHAITVCGDDKIVVPPLIILDRDEEEAHTNLVVLNTSQFEGCWFTLSNRWPLNQDWLYVDENGLHARSIDREHESIAFMALSQVQVELILHCDTDNVVRTKRSERTDWLGPYDYGSNRWILTESIAYNARRSLVNLIVNDINDNAPIFVGKNLEPIAVGYPTGELEERILPRSLAELQATDADIGENAALRYWSSEEVLAVAPTTGFVHVKNGVQLEHDQRLIVRATDRNGQGLTGEIELVVKLLELDNIVVVTVRDSFLDDEKTILDQLTNAVGYEVKVLRSLVISEHLDDDDNNTRKKRDTNSEGSLLLLYIYGLLQREPVGVERLTVDLNNNAAAVSIINTVSLEDHLEPVEIITSERDVGLLVATIVLSVLLFIALVLIAVWFFLRWRKNKTYNEFSDENSLTSKSSVEHFPKPEYSTPRINIEELKRSEKRLQDMLKTRIEEVTVEPIPTRREEVTVQPVEAILDISPVETNAPIVIQSIDKLKDSEDTDEDEFGEKKKPRRKSVVTFNENVEKIIHVENDVETGSVNSDFEIFKF